MVKGETPLTLEGQFVVHRCGVEHSAKASTPQKRTFNPRLSGNGLMVVLLSCKVNYYFARFR